MAASRLSVLCSSFKFTEQVKPQELGLQLKVEGEEAGDIQVEQAMEVSEIYLLYSELEQMLINLPHIQRYVNEDKFTPRQNLLKTITTKKESNITGRRKIQSSHQKSMYLWEFLVSQSHPLQQKWLGHLMCNRQPTVLV